MKTKFFIIILSIWIICSMNVWGQEIKYRCPNGCEGATFSYMYSMTTAMGWTQWTMNEEGKKIYHKDPNIKTDYYQCSKCGKRFTNWELIETAKAYNDSLANANKKDITDSYYPGNPKYTWDGKKWVRKDYKIETLKDSLKLYIYGYSPEENWTVKVTYIIPPELQTILDSLEKRIAELEDKCIK